MTHARRVVLSVAAAFFAAATARVALTFAGGRVTEGDPWKELEKLVSEQKFEEAAAKAGKIREAARAAGDEANEAKALVREVQLRTALHGYETAVRFLKDQPWPRGLLPRTTLRLFYAQSLVTYAQAYGWEIGKREKVESTGPVDLRAWTRDQIQAEAVRAYVDVWKDREALGRVPVNAIADFVEPNNYPKEIRGTLRDAASYLFAALLADTSGWRPEQSNGVFALDAKALVAGDPGASRLVKLDDPAVHPLLKLGAVLDDLEAWHAAAGEKEAALEARLERLRRLDAALTDAGDRAAIRKDLAARLPAFADVPWFSMGKAQLADFVREEDKPGSLVRARTLALEAIRAYPKSLGAERGRSIVAQIEAPDWQMAAMAADGAGRRSIEVTHRNLATLYFRAYAVDLEGRLGRARDYNLLPQGKELDELVARETPAAAFEASLPPTPDYRSHRTFVTPPVLGRGLHILVASADPGFSPGKGPLRAAGMIETDLVLAVRQTETNAVEARALTGTTGRPAAGARVSLYLYDWQKGHRRIAEATASRDGLATFEPTPERTGKPLFLFARRGDDVALDAASLSMWARGQPGEATSALAYTDRSIYRPLQKVLWKAIVYSGRADEARFHVAPATTVSMTLVDANGQAVESKTVTTNAYGSAAGEFALPAGRALGAWQVRCDRGGAAAIRVEEYKRPTFEATLPESKEALRLNRPATFHGEARYYFGLPVTNGSVGWRVTRETEYPWWWWWGWLGGGRPAGAETVATGTAALGADGTFAVTFTPRADERASRELTYRYRLSADVTDEGGETRSAERSFRLGFVSVKATVERDRGFFLEGKRGERSDGGENTLKIVRTDLDGAPRAGKGSWRLLRLTPPERTLLPSEFSISLPSKKSENGTPLADPGGADDEASRARGSREFPLRTPGDLLRPRWSADYSVDEWLHSWRDGAEEGSGALVHDAKGEAKVDLPALQAGAYRLRYSTVDDFGATYETSQDFLVADGKTSPALPLVLLAESSSVRVGGVARFLVASGLRDQTMFLDVARAGRPIERRVLRAGKEPVVVERTITEEDRGGLGVTLTAVRDHQFLQQTQSVFVPWDDRELKVSFATFRDRLRPGQTETWRVTVKGATPEHPLKETAELLAYMYDRSLDAFVPHRPPSPLALLPNRATPVVSRATLGQAPQLWLSSSPFPAPPSPPYLYPDRLKFESGYGIGGPGRHGVMGGVMGGVAGGPYPMSAPMAMKSAVARQEVALNAAAEGRAVGAKDERSEEADSLSKKEDGAMRENAAGDASAGTALRSNFSETAFWQPHLLTGPDGSASIEFTVPDSVTSWRVFVHAVTKDLRGGSVEAETKTVKDLIVRPYVPRFLREGDKAEIKVVVNDASAQPLSGTLAFEITDPATGESLLHAFGLAEGAASKPFTAPAGGGTNLTFPVTAPKGLTTVAFKAVATAGDLSDGEVRPLPILPGRMHLVESRFVTLKNRDRKTLRFDDLAKNDDPTLVNEQMVVTVDAQLFYTVLQALPYLVNYPYECTEQTLNRFLSTGIVSSVYKDYPAVAKMAAEMSKRTTPLESWDATDPNRKMALEETPWLAAAKGGRTDLDTIDVLDPRVAKANQESALQRLRKAQTAIGAFPWFPGGPPSPYMTLYILHGFAKGLEFGVDVPKDVTTRAWGYVAQHWRSDWRACMAKDGCWEFITFLNYVLSAYPDVSWSGGVFTDAERKEMLDFSFRHWKAHSPFLKGYLALTLERMGRRADAKLVWDSVMDSAKSNEEQGTFWAPEDRSWLWYNDTIETQAFALRTLLELDPSNPKLDGLVQWLLLHKKLNQWKSTRATAEAIYSLVKYLKKEGALGMPEDATVTVGTQKVTFTFDPEKYTGKNNRVVIPGGKVDPKTTSTIVVEKESKGFLFASAAWHFSTEKLPAEDRGDFFQVSRKYFRRENKGSGFTLEPLAEGAVIRPGDEIEVQISLRTKHDAEYVHLRDPRAAGLEPENALSRWKWDLGIAWYEETRDSATNFFFERLPVGEYTFKYRLRANMAGTFRVGPATVQSMYAPEFNAYSAGAVLKVAGGSPP
ncbi:MAG TPA: alpha-2-macroglobulin family protein [Thermoanaerobaculia bacterium]|nr:alpha-2-macroglobulin family protein [Thermoanaerobaculia bacterium]